MAKKKIAAETTVASFNGKPNVRDLRFGKLEFTSGQCQQLIDWMDGKEKVRLTIEQIQQNLTDKKVNKIQGSAVIKSCNMKPNERDPRFDKIDFTNTEFDQVADWMDNKEKVRVTFESISE